MKLLMGSTEGTKMQVHTVYNLEHPDNDVIDRSQGVIVDSEIDIPAAPKGKGYKWLVDTTTLEQTLELVDIPLTDDQQTIVDMKAENAMMMLALVANDLI